MSHVRPQRLVIRLEHDPLKAAIDRRLEKQQQPPHGDILPVGIRAQRAGAHHANAPLWNMAEAIDVLVVEPSLPRERDRLFQPRRQRDDLVGRGFPGAAVPVDARENPANEPARRKVQKTETPSSAS
jgi:hypothetical protein